MKKIFFLISAVTVIFLSYGWFFVVSPTFVSKPLIEKPILAGEPEEGHVNWVVNELSAYKLHSNPFSGEAAEMEIIILDLGKTFTTVVEDNVPITREGKGENPDIRIKINSENFMRLYEAENLEAEAVRLFKEGKAEVELLKPETELAVKGYKAIYDELGV